MDAGNIEHFPAGIGRARSVADGCEDVVAVEVIAYLYDLLHGDAHLAANILRNSEFASVTCAEAKVVHTKFGSAAGNEFALLGGDDTRADAVVMKDLQSQAVTGVELLKFVAVLSVVHAAVGKSTVNIAEEQFYIIHIG